MGGLDELVDQVDEEKEIEEAKTIMNELGIEDQEELEELEQKLDRVQSGLIHYDKKMERLEQRIDILEGAVAKVLKQSADVSTTETGEQNKTNDQQTATTEEETASWDKGGSDDGDGLNWG